MTMLNPLRYNALDATGAPTVKPNSLTAREAELVDRMRCGDFTQIDEVVVCISGGKDSTACLLEVLSLIADGIESGTLAPADAPRVTLMHHLVDGSPDEELLFDWPVTEAYCRALAAAFNLPLVMSWREGGIGAEILKKDAKLRPSTFEDSGTGELVRIGGLRGKTATRMMFPAIQADLSKRWCSAVAKIDVCARAITNDSVFSEAKVVVVVTGERREEGKTSKTGAVSGRATYAEADRHRSSKAKNAEQADRYLDEGKREVISWRPILGWSEQRVWQVIQTAGVRAHPAYEAGFGRTSCAFCIFGGSDQFATAAWILPEQWARFVAVEDATVAHHAADASSKMRGTMKSNASLRELVAKGSVYPAAKQAGLRDLLRSTSWPAELPIMIDPTTWTLPAGAFADCSGPN